MTDSSELATYRRLFAEKAEELQQLLQDLPAPALLWKPFEQSPWQGSANSLGLIIAHSLSSTIYLLRRAEWTLGRIQWSQIDGDEGSEEFGPANHDPAYLRARIERTQAFVNELLGTLSDADLAGSRPHPKRAERVFTVRYDVQHAIEHMSQHIGHGQLTRQLWALQEMQTSG
jgi:DinB superfamily